MKVLQKFKKLLLQELCLIINKKIICLFFLFLTFSVYSQTDWVRWEKSDPSYQQEDDYEQRDYNLSIESVSDIFVKPIVNAYWFFISDVDGANCPFHPSCSSFLVQSIQETNPVQGTIMFFDRFTRDTNIFGRLEHYPRYGKRHYYDPITLYILDKQQIKIISVNTFVDDEH
jgi:putative component of membrane protein insertase Oxa1/YidC/SpoIIIJ protein YidD